MSLGTFTFQFPDGAERTFRYRFKEQRQMEALLKQHYGKNESWDQFSMRMNEWSSDDWLMLAMAGCCGEEFPKDAFDELPTPMVQAWKLEVIRCLMTPEEAKKNEQRLARLRTLTDQIPEQLLSLSGAGS